MFHYASVPLREQLNLDLRPPCERVPPQNSKGTNRLWRGWKGAGRRYFGGCSSPLSQPITLSVLIGSGRSHSKHWNMRGPFPSEGAATNIRYAPHLGHLNRSTWPMSVILPPTRNLVHFKVGALHRMNTYGFLRVSAFLHFNVRGPRAPIGGAINLGFEIGRLLD